MTTKTQAENEKIAQAMKGQAALRRRASAKERATGGIGALRPAPTTGREQAGLDPIPVNHDAGLQEGERPLAEKEKPMTTKTPKEPRVLSDPVANARLIRMRAKWTAIRVERRVARAEEAVEVASNPEQRREANGRLKVLRSELAEAKSEEKKAYKAYRVLLEARQAEKKAAKTASKTAGAA